jgi:hypothetical protein
MQLGSASSVPPPRPLAEQAAANLRHPLSLTLLALTLSTGTVDAVSYLGLGHVFTAGRGCLSRRRSGPTCSTSTKLHASASSFAKRSVGEPT